MKTPSIRQARVRKVETLGPGLREITFATLDGPLPYEPGQWLSFQVREDVDGGKGLWRVYSLSSSPDEGAAGQGSQVFSILVDVTTGGPGGEHFATLEPGHRQSFHGPHGEFTLQDTTASRVVLVADGVGIGPVRGMLRRLCGRGQPPCPVILIHEATVPHGLAFRGEFERWDEEMETFRYICSVPGGESDWHGENRELLELVPALFPHQQELEGAHWYLCGAGSTTDRVRAWLAAKGVAPEQVRSERFSD